MKILLIQLSGAGDVLQSTLLIRCLKKSLPDAELHVLVQQPFAEIVATNPYIDHLHRLHFNEQTTLHELMPQNFDHVLDLQPGNQSAHFVAQLQPPIAYPKQKGWKTFLTQLFNRTPMPQHKAERYLQKGRTLNIENDGGGLDFLIPKKDAVPFADIPASHHAGFIAIATSATTTFQWPLYLLQQLCSSIAHPIILLGSEKEAPLAEKIKAIDTIKIYNACGKFSLYETADLVRKAKLLIAFQPYFIQLGAACNKEMVMLATSANEDPPYYNPKFLNSRNTTPYDSMPIPKDLLRKESIITVDEKMQMLMRKTAEQLKIKVEQRLKGGA